MIRMSKGRFHELSHDWLWKTAEITTTSRGSKVESALLSPLPTMNRIEKYRDFFTKDCLMGPNSIRLLDELLRRNSFGAPSGRVLDLGCGRTLTSAFLARETPADTVYAFDLWISATDNWERIRSLGLADRIVPIHGDALALPFAQGWFDAMVSVDAYHYFGCREGVFAQKILPYVRQGGSVMIAVPGLKAEPRGELRSLFDAWAGAEDALCFHTCAWWKNLLEKEGANQCEIAVLEAECFDAAWQDWFDTGHEYALRDQEVLKQGLDQVLNFALIHGRKK